MPPGRDDKTGQYSTDWNPGKWQNLAKDVAEDSGRRKRFLANLKGTGGLAGAIAVEAAASGERITPHEQTVIGTLMANQQVLSRLTQLLVNVFSSGDTPGISFPRVKDRQYQVVITDPQMREPDEVRYDL